LPVLLGTQRCVESTTRSLTSLRGRRTTTITLVGCKCVGVCVALLVGSWSAWLHNRDRKKRRLPGGMSQSRRLRSDSSKHAVTNNGTVFRLDAPSVPPVLHVFASTPSVPHVLYVRVRLQRSPPLPAFKITSNVLWPARRAQLQRPRAAMPLPPFPRTLTTATPSSLVLRAILNDARPVGRACNAVHEPTSSSLAPVLRPLVGQAIVPQSVRRTAPSTGRPLRHTSLRLDMPTAKNVPQQETVAANPRCFD
jgi:hypothetical protein